MKELLAGLFPYFKKVMSFFFKRAERKAEIIKEVSIFPRPAFEILKKAYNDGVLIRIIDSNNGDSFVRLGATRFSCEGVPDSEIVGAVGYLIANFYIAPVPARPGRFAYSVSKKGADLFHDMKRYKIPASSD